MKTKFKRSVVLCVAAGIVVCAHAQVSNSVAPRSKERPTIRLNFRQAPLENVLSYLSDAAGYTIILHTPLRGNIDAWNNQPLTPAEAIEVLNVALNKNGLSAIEEGRTITIMTTTDAKKGNTPVKRGAALNEIPANNEIVTQIIPLNHLNAAELLRDLQALIPTSAMPTSNDGGNAIIITDTQVNIRHLVEIVRILDTSLAAATRIRVFPLQFADSKSLTAILKELFSADTARDAQAGQTGPGNFGRGGGPGGPGGPGNLAAVPTSNRSSARASNASRVLAVSDDRGNAVIVAAPEDVMTTIADLIQSMDVNVSDVSELRVFRLKNSDPTEMVEVLSNLFPDETKSNGNNNSNGPTFGLPFSGPTPNVASSSSAGAPSERAKKQEHVVAVADPRTSSIIVSASHASMKAVADVVAQLDSDSKKKRKVYIYSLNNGDPQQVQQVLQNIFESDQNNNSSARSSAQNSLLTARAQQQTQSGRNSTTGSGMNSGGGAGSSAGAGTAGR